VCDHWGRSVASVGRMEYKRIPRSHQSEYRVHLRRSEEVNRGRWRFVMFEGRKAEAGRQGESLQRSLAWTKHVELQLR
jgi:hypothetical protein